MQFTKNEWLDYLKERAVQEALVDSLDHHNRSTDNYHCHHNSGYINIRDHTRYHDHNDRQFSVINNPHAQQASEHKKNDSMDISDWKEESTAPSSSLISSHQSQPTPPTLSSSVFLRYTTNSSLNIHMLSQCSSPAGRTKRQRRSFNSPNFENLEVHTQSIPFSSRCTHDAYILSHHQDLFVYDYPSKKSKQQDHVRTLI